MMSFRISSNCKNSQTAANHVCMMYKYVFVKQSALCKYLSFFIDVTLYIYSLYEGNKYTVIVTVSTSNILYNLDV